VLCQVLAISLVGGCLTEGVDETQAPSSRSISGELGELGSDSRDPEAAPAALANLALGKTATQSSTAFGGDAARAVDGNVDGDFFAGSVTSTEHEAQAWWQVDLGAMTDIGEVVIYNRTDCCSERLADFDVLVSRDGVAWRA